METVNDYLRNLLYKKSNNYQYNRNEEQSYRYLCDLINQWKQQYNSQNYYWGNSITIETMKSGSKAKGDAIKGKSDVDIFVSITDPNNQHTVKEYYEDLYSFLKPRFATNSLRKQNVSIGITYNGCSIDVTPGKRVNHSTYVNYRYYNDHNIYSRKNDSNTLTNIQLHIDMVRNSGLTDEMMVLKIWRDCHNLELPSIAIEIITCEVLKHQRTSSLYNNVKKVFETLRDTILYRRIIDPANTNNNIADTLTYSEKENIRKAAIDSLSYDYGNEVTMNKIVW